MDVETMSCAYWVSSKKSKYKQALMHVVDQDSCIVRQKK